MKEVDFAVTINMRLSLGGDRVAVSVRNVDLNPAMISLSVEGVTPKLNEKKTYHDIIREMAQELVDAGKKAFSAADLYNRAKGRYPYVKRHVFSNRVMAAAPEHGSWESLSGKKDFLKYLGNGKYEMKGG